jgi:hypothetical protein
MSLSSKKQREMMKQTKTRWHTLEISNRTSVLWCTPRSNDICSRHNYRWCPSIVTNWKMKPERTECIAVSYMRPLYVYCVVLETEEKQSNNMHQNILKLIILYSWRLRILTTCYGCSVRTQAMSQKVIWSCPSVVKDCKKSITNLDWLESEVHGR